MFIHCDRRTAAVIMQRHCRPKVGLTTTRRGEMTSSNVIRRRCQSHTLPASPSCHGETGSSSGLPRHGSETPFQRYHTLPASPSRHGDPGPSSSFPRHGSETPFQHYHTLPASPSRHGETGSPSSFPRHGSETPFQHYHTLPASPSRHVETGPSSSLPRHGSETPFQHYHTLPASPSRHGETGLPSSFPQHGSGTPCIDAQTTDVTGRWTTAHRLSSTLPLPRRAQLGVKDDRLCNASHSKPCRHRSHQFLCDRLYQRHHHQQQQQLQPQAFMALDSLQPDDQNSAFSRVSTMRSGNETVNSSSTGYYTDCESELSKHRYQRQPQRRRRLPQAPTAHTRSRHPARQLTSARSFMPAAGNHQELRSAATSKSKHGDVEFHESVRGRQSGRGREKFQTRSRSCDGTRNDDMPTNYYCSPGASRRTKYADRPYATWSGTSGRRSPASFVIDGCSEPQQLAWKLHIPHGILSLRSTRWSEVSGLTVTRRSASLDGWRQRNDCQWLTIPRLPRRSSLCDGRRSHTLPASFRLRRRSGVATVTDDRVSLEPIGRGVETLECEQCYLAAMSHLRPSSAAGLHTTLPALVVDGIESSGHRHRDDLTGTSRYDRLQNVIRRQHQGRQDYIRDSPTATPPKTPSKSMMTANSLHSNHLSSCCHCNGILTPKF